MSDNKTTYQKFSRILKGQNTIPKGSQPVYRGQLPKVPKGSHPIQRGPVNRKFKFAGSQKLNQGLQKYFKKKKQ